MSSLAVRTDFLSFLTTNAPTENVLDLTGSYLEVHDFVIENGLTVDDPWLGVQFIGSDEVPVTIDATNNQGRYREIGAFYLHVVDIAKLTASSNILTRGEALRNLLRARRINDIVIESVSPLNFDDGATLQFDGGYISASFIATYNRDFTL